MPDVPAPADRNPQGRLRAMRAMLQTVMLAVYRRLPLTARLLVLRWMTPSYQVGALCVVERADGALLLLRQSYRRREAWGFPGGLLKRGEQPVDAVRREVREELGVVVEVEDAPMVVVEPRYRRVDIVYKGRLSPMPAGAEDQLPTPSSPEILEVRWFAPNQLPILLPEATTALVEMARAARPSVEDG